MPGRFHVDIDFRGGRDSVSFDLLYKAIHIGAMSFVPRSRKLGEMKGLTTSALLLGFAGAVVSAQAAPYSTIKPTTSTSTRTSQTVTSKTTSKSTKSSTTIKPTSSSTTSKTVTSSTVSEVSGWGQW